MKRLIALALPLIFSACAADNTPPSSGVSLADGWQEQVIATWNDQRPDMIVVSSDGGTLFVSCENRANMLAPSLVRIDLSSGKKETLIYGLHRADALKAGPTGDLWLGEETEEGRVYRIRNPHTFPAEQRWDRDRMVGSHADIRPVAEAGVFAHEGLAFSKDGRYLYLADEWVEGCLFRLDLQSNTLAVLHKSEGWKPLRTISETRLQAEILHGKIFERLEDLERLPDGRILLAETGAGEKNGRVWLLDDSGKTPQLSLYLEHETMHRPDNLEWDTKRNILWITDDDDPSSLYAWDGKELTTIARHENAEITGVETSKAGDVYINLQNRAFGPEMTLRISEK